MIKNLFVWIVFSLLFNKLSYAEVPSWVFENDIPNCPTSGVRLLSDDYPAMGVVLGDFIVPGRSAIQLVPPRATEFVASFIQQTLLSAEKQVPIFYTAVDKSSTQLILKKVLELVRQGKNSSYEYASYWTKSNLQFRGLPALKTQFHRDFFRSFTDFSSGLPILHNIFPYENSTMVISGQSVPFGDVFINSLQALFPDLSGPASDGIRVGDALLKVKQNNYPSEMTTAAKGGNLSALPGGLCLHGENLPPSMAKYYCGSVKNEVVIPTNWLAVGHADEIVSVVKKDHPVSGCGFSVVLPSPRLGIRLMKEQVGLSFVEGPEQFHPDSYLKNVSHLNSVGHLQKLQRWLKEKNHPGTGNYEIKEVGGLDNLDMLLLFFWNGQLDKNYELAGDLLYAQKMIDQTKKIVKKALSKRLPQCAADLDFIELPVLYYDMAQFIPGVKGMKLRTLLPNPVNLVSIGKNAISAEPQNKAFSEFIHHEFIKRGIYYRPVDISNYGHPEGAGVHCMVQEMRVCKPSL